MWNYYRGPTMARAVYNIITLPMGWAQETTAMYYTPLGRSIQAKGITPDLVLSNNEGKIEKIIY